jgi:hypothetical protein
VCCDVLPQFGLVEKPYWLMIAAFWQTAEPEPTNTVVYGAVPICDVGTTL